MRLNSVDHQTLKLLNDAADEEIMRWVKGMIAGTVTRIVRHGIHPDGEKCLRKCLPLVWQDLQKCSPRTLPTSMPEHVAAALVVLIRLKLPHSQTPFITIAQRAAHSMIDTAAENEMLCQMPMPKRERRQTPADPVEARAAQVEAKVKEWERKLRYAKTKLANYRKKQTRLLKKGQVRG